MNSAAPLKTWPCTPLIFSFVFRMKVLSLILSNTVLLINVIQTKTFAFLIGQIPFLDNRTFIHVA